MQVREIFSRSKTEDTKTIFVDTNTFLHYAPPEEIDWFRIVGTNSIRIIISYVVLRELDKIKYENRSSKIKERARESLRRIEKYSSAEQNSDSGLSFLITDHVSGFNFLKHGLDPQLFDDRIIGDIITYRKTHKKNNIILLTNDLSFNFRAKKYEIDSISLGDEYKLKEEPDENEKKIKQLERELAYYKDKNPQPKISFHGGHNRKVFKIRKPYEPKEGNIDNIISRIKRSNPRIEARIGGGLFDIMNGITSEEMERYNKEYSDYERAIEKYVKESTEWKNIVRRSIKLELILFNHGNAPAEDIDISLVFPGHVKLIRSDYFPKLIGKPEYPEEPKTMSEKLGASIRLNSILYNSTNETDTESQRMEVIDSGIFEFYVDKLKHNRSKSLPILYVFFPYNGEPKGFKIEYRINSETISNDISGSINVIIKK
jgi:rRNA-processing protein FCF1